MLVQNVQKTTQSLIFLINVYHTQTRKTNILTYPQVVTKVKFVINFVFRIEAAVLLLPHVFSQHLVCLKDFLTTQTL